MNYIVKMNLVCLRFNGKNLSINCKDKWLNMNNNCWCNILKNKSDCKLQLAIDPN